MDQADSISALLDNQAITQLVARYGRAVDWLDIAGMKACFTETARVRFGEHALPAHDFCDFWAAMGNGLKARHHMFGVPVIAPQGEGRAAVDVPALAACTKAEEGARMRDFAECNRYVWHVVRVDGRWRIEDARIFIVWSQGGPTPTGMEAGPPLDHDVTMDNPAFVVL